MRRTRDYITGKCISHRHGTVIVAVVVVVVVIIAVVIIVIVTIVVIVIGIRIVIVRVIVLVIVLVIGLDDLGDDRDDDYFFSLSTILVARQTISHYFKKFEREKTEKRIFRIFF